MNARDAVKDWMENGELLQLPLVPGEGIRELATQHDALVEALEECIWVLEAIERGSLKARTLARAQLTKAKAALRQAKGE